MEYPHLGLHSKYEIGAGSRELSDVIAKAKFLRVNALGICDTNTLSGTFAFQKACKKAKMPFVLGMEATVKRGDISYNIKLYAKNKAGWQNLLRISKAIKIDNNGFVKESELTSRGKGIIAVLTPTAIPLFNKAFFYKFKDNFDDFYCQIDFVKYSTAEKDEQHLNNLQQYFKELFPACPPVLIQDSYYLDKEDYVAKQRVANIANKELGYISEDQYMKSIDEIYNSAHVLFKEEHSDFLMDIFEMGVANAETIASKCKFEIETGKLHLPKYKMTQEEQDLYGDIDTMFMSLINDGLERIGKQDDERYLERITEELSVIDLGGYRDYFLITYDICNYSDKQGILRGLGRGSAASSLILYCMNVTMIDPIAYNLPFARFLNEQRVKSGLPDVDLDFASKRRPEVKEYIVERYGYNQTAYIGTYIYNKVKSALQALGGEYGIDAKVRGIMSSKLPQRAGDEPTNLTELFKYINQTPDLKKYFQENSEMINEIDLVLGSIKTTSIHAAGVIVFPEYDEAGNRMEVYDWIPVRKGDNALLTDFVGTEMDDLGFLKEDILGVSELDNVGDIFKMVEKRYGKKLTQQNIPLDDEKTFMFFQEGYTQQTFQFNSSGMTGMLMDMYPTDIQHLIAANALYRPGAMGSGSHHEYIKVKNGERKATPPWGYEEITKDTYGILVYQEQVIFGVQQNAGFSLAEGDILRSALGKKKQDVLDSMKPRFIDGIMAKGCSKQDAENTWMLMESFGSYSFNYSHAACYGILGYITMYLKANYPLEFYTAALELANDDERPLIISEINKVGSIKLSPPDINNSNINFVSNVAKNTIYWSISSIKQMGGERVNHFLEKREGSGFYSVKDLFDKVEKKKIHKGVVTNLILSGAFDEVYNLPSNKPSQRIKILREYYEDVLKTKLPEEFSDGNKVWKDYIYVMKAKELTGLGYIDYNEIMHSSTIFSKNADQLINTVKFYQDSAIDSTVVVAGIVHKIVERKTKRGKMLSMVVDFNSEFIDVTVWSDIYEPSMDLFKKSEGNIILISGIVRFDSYKKKNVLHTKAKTRVDFI